MSPEDQYAIRPGLEVENKVDEMFRIVQVKFQARDGSTDSDSFLMVLAGGLKEFRYGHNFHNAFVFNGLQKVWGEGSTSDQLA